MKTPSGSTPGVAKWPAPVPKCIGLTFLLFFLAITGSLAQTPVDSLEKTLPATTGRKRAETLYLLSWEYRFSDKEKALRYGEEGLQLARQLHDTIAIASSLNSLSETHLNFGDFDQAEKLTREELPYARVIQHWKTLLGALTRLGTIHYRHGRLDSALVYQLEVQRYAEYIKKPELTGVASLNLGLTYMDLKRFEEALKYFQGALEAFQATGFTAGMGACYVNIAETLRSRKQYPEALEAAYKAESILLKSGNKLHLGYIYGIMVDLFEAVGDSPKRLEYARKALAMAQANQDELSIAQSESKLGRALLETGDPDAARPYFDTSLLRAEKMQQKSLILENYANLRDWHLLHKDFARAGWYDEKFTAGLDSVFTSDMAEKIADAQTKYETEKQGAEIATQKLALLRQRLWIFGLAGGLVALVVLGYVFYHRYRLRQKAELAAAVIREQKLGLNAVIEAQENERKRIAKDLHDGIAQELVALHLGFNLLRHKLQKTAPAEAGQLGELSEQLDHSCTEVRNIAHLMLPPALEQYGLAPGLEILLRHTAQSAGFDARFDSNDLPPALDEKTRIGLYRIAQELLNNIVKHARASKVTVRLFGAGNHLVLQVEDDGPGFDFEAARQKGSMGILNILSRVGTLGGSFFAEKIQPRGMMSVVRVPVE